MNDAEINEWLLEHNLTGETDLRILLRAYAAHVNKELVEALRECKRLMKDEGWEFQIDGEALRECWLKVNETLAKNGGGQ